MTATILLKANTEIPHKTVTTGIEKSSTSKIKKPKATTPAENLKGLAKG
ncbi:hypothetical protein IMX26_05705 [Clostridium sp. 'deep sea']|nr:hypothetical protein [Clostridium sp. 'deep sea']QOR36308.1 hypothetical protein IMX26_05705 [Clostridium sp. 'deep sea']